MCFTKKCDSMHAVTSTDRSCALLARYSPKSRPTGYRLPVVTSTFKKTCSSTGTALPYLIVPVLHDPFEIPRDNVFLSVPSLCNQYIDVSNICTITKRLLVAIGALLTLIVALHK